MEIMKCFRLAILILLLLIQTSFAGEQAYQYYPNKAVLTGTLTKKMFYGPPGFGEDPKHDKKEHVFILKLAKPIKVVAESSDYTSHDNIRELQVNNLRRLKLNPMLKKKVIIKGTLYSASIGHDYTNVLIDAEEVTDTTSASKTGISQSEHSKQ
jgi:hypothetical protein